MSPCKPPSERHRLVVAALTKNADLQNFSGFSRFACARTVQFRFAHSSDEFEVGRAAEAHAVNTLLNRGIYYYSGELYRFFYSVYFLLLAVLKVQSRL